MGKSFWSTLYTYVSPALRLGHVKCWIQSVTFFKDVLGKLVCYKKTSTFEIQFLIYQNLKQNTVFQKKKNMFFFVPILRIFWEKIFSSRKFKRKLIGMITTKIKLVPRGIQEAICALTSNVDVE